MNRRAFLTVVLAAATAPLAGTVTGSSPRLVPTLRPDIAELLRDAAVAAHAASDGLQRMAMAVDLGTSRPTYYFDGSAWSNLPPAHTDCRCSLAVKVTGP